MPAAKWSINKPASRRAQPAVAGRGLSEGLGLSTGMPMCAHLVEPHTSDEAQPTSPWTCWQLPNGLREMCGQLKAAGVHVDHVADECTENVSGELGFAA